MKRKYYMRGLGIGILVTAILCAVALPKKTEPMTDEEVIARAKELGYVKDEGGVTADDIDKIKENEKLTGTPDASQAPDATEEPEDTPGPTPSPVPTPEPPEKPDEPDKPEQPATPTPAEEKKPTVTPVPTDVPAITSYTITVERGATARRVAERLAAVGAIEDAEAFVKHLQSNRLTDFINIGTFSIPQGASYTEIARILTGR